MIRIQELQGTSRPACREALRNGADETKQHDETEGFDGLFHVEFSRTAAARGNT
jgi:hypothetical protein